jgi:hypothetical protein
MKAPISQKALQMLNDPDKVGKLLQAIDRVRVSQRKAMESITDEKILTPRVTVTRSSAE